MQDYYLPAVDIMGAAWHDFRAWQGLCPAVIFHDQRYYTEF